MVLFRWAAYATIASSMVLGAGIARATLVNDFDAAYSANGSWFVSQAAASGSASVVSLSGVGGKLESDQPLPSGAARLTTALDNASRIDVAVRDDYGLAGNILRSLALSYSYYRENQPGGNTSAAPSLKLTFFNSNYVGDGFVTLVYEPYWQPNGVVNNPIAGEWIDATISFSTGLFWQNGGFGQASSAGGPPLRTLEGWLATFDSGFGGAELTQISIGMGTFNQGVTGYFDDVRVAHSFGGGYSANYDFELSSTGQVPSPASLPLVAVSLMLLAMVRRRSGGQ